MNGLLDFLKTPEGQGLLAAGFGYAATANSRTPVQNVGRAGLAGLAGYSNGLDNQRQLALAGIQQQKMQQELDAAQRTRAARENLRGTLPQDKQALFDAAPDKYLESLPDFQKPVVGENYDNQGRPVKGVWRGTEFTQVGGAKSDLPEGMRIGANGLPEFIPEYLAGRRQIASAGKTSVNVTNAGPKAFETELAKLDAQKLDEYRKNAESAKGILTTVGNMRSAVNEGVYSGGLANAKTEVANVIQGLTGVSPKNLYGSQMFNAEASKLVLDSIKQLGANPSNSDREFIEKTIPRLAMDPKARESLINFMEQKAAGSVGLYEQADTYARQNRGLGGFNPVGNQKPSAPQGQPDLAAAARAELERRKGGR